MQNMENLQLLKEQLKARTAEVKKFELEKNKISEKVKNVLSLHEKKVTDLKTRLKEMEDSLVTAQSSSFAKGLFSGSSEKSSAAESAASSASGGGGSGPAKEVLVQDPELLKELQELREKNRELMSSVNVDTGEKERLINEKNILLKEMRRMRKDPETVEKLKEQIAKLTVDADKLKEQSKNSIANIENLLKEKDEIIKSYEKMLYGQTEPGQEGMLPSEIIDDLKVELKTLLEEKKVMTLELEQLKEINADLELKVSLAGEQTATLDNNSNTNSADLRTHQAESHGGTFWVSFSDMITLILCIFILLYALAPREHDPGKLDVVLSSFQEKSGSVDSLNARLTQKEMRMLERVRELVKDNVDPDSLVRTDTKTILIRLPNEELFNPGNADLARGADNLIFNSIQDHMKDGVKQVQIEGHTDDIPVKTEKFPSNWELSTARASSVAKFVIEKFNFPPAFVVVSGYGSYRPLKENNSDHNRAQNRRVEIKILKDKDVIAEKEKKEGAKAGGAAEPKSKTGETENKKSAEPASAATAPPAKNATPPAKKESPA